MIDEVAGDKPLSRWHRNHVVIALFAVGGPFLLIYFIIYLILAKLVEIAVKALAKQEKSN